MKNISSWSEIHFRLDHSNQLSVGYVTKLDPGDLLNWSFPATTVIDPVFVCCAPMGLPWRWFNRPTETTQWLESMCAAFSHEYLRTIKWAVKHFAGNQHKPRRAPLFIPNDNMRWSSRLCPSDSSKRWRVLHPSFPMFHHLLWLNKWTLTTTLISWAQNEWISQWKRERVLWSLLIPFFVDPPMI